MAAKMKGVSLAKLYPIFSTDVYALLSSISVMKMLVEQAENNILTALKEADYPGAVKESDFQDTEYDHEGKPYTLKKTIYSLGSCIGYDYDEVKLEFKMTITQLIRRSAFLTIFGIFEHRVKNCLDFIDNLEGKKESNIKNPLERAHFFLKEEMGAKQVEDVDHLTIIRNIMIHNDSQAHNYHYLIAKKERKSTFERRLISSIERTKKVRVTRLNTVIMDEDFLGYAVSEFNRYAKQIDTAIQTHIQKITKN